MMSQSARNIDRLSEAMRTLDELASQEKDEIKDLLSNQFGNLRKTILEIEPEVRGTIRHASERLSAFASTSKDAARARLKKIGENVDEKVHEMPWAFMGISTILGIAAGYYLGFQIHSRK